MRAMYSGINRVQGTPLAAPSRVQNSDAQNTINFCDEEAFISGDELDQDWDWGPATEQKITQTAEL